MSPFRRWIALGIGGAIGLFGIVYTAVYLSWNDAAMGRFVSTAVSQPLRGSGGSSHQALVIERIHYPYWGSLKSLLLGGAATVEAWSGTVYDPDGAEVIHAPRLHCRVWIGELVWAQVRSLLGRWDLELHFADVEIPMARARIGLDHDGRINLVDAFTSHPGLPPGDGGMRIRIDSMRLDDVSYAMAMPGWHGEAEHASASAQLTMSTFPEEQEAHKLAFHFQVTPLFAPRASLTLGSSPEFVFPIEQLALSRFDALGAERQDLHFEGTATTRGAPVAIAGRLLNYASQDTGVDLTIRFRDGSGLVKMLPTGPLLGGSPQGEVWIHGPLAHVLMEGRIEQGEVHVAGALGTAAAARFRLQAGQLALSEIRSDVAGGMVRGDLTVDFNRLAWSGSFSSDRVDPNRLGPLVPRAIGRALTGRLGGRFQVSASLIHHPERIHVRKLDLSIERAKRDLLPRRIAVQGAVEVTPQAIGLAGLSVSGDGVTAQATGTIDPRGRTLGTLRLDSDHLGQLLHRIGLVVDIGGLHALAKIDGPIAEPRIDGTLRATTVATGKRLFPSLDGHLHLEHGTVAIDSLRAGGPPGGEFGGEVSFGLFEGRFDRPSRDPKLHVHLTTRSLSLSALTGVPSLTGQASGELSLDGTLAHPHGRLAIEVPELRWYDDPYRSGLLEMAIADGRYRVEQAHLIRVQGGRLWGDGTVGPSGALDLRLRSEDFPLAALPLLRGVPVAWGGTLSGSVHIGGGIERWLPSGAIEAWAIKVREILLGDGKLDLLPGDDAIRLSGEFFERFKVDGFLQLQPHIAVNATISFEEFPLDELIPELKKLAEVHGIVSGFARVSFDASTDLMVGELRLSKVALALSGEEEGEEHGGARSAEFHNEGDVIIATDGKKLTFVQAHLRGTQAEGKGADPVGEFQIAGDLSSVNSNLSVKGHIQLELVEYFFANLFAHTHGDADADLTILGPAARPQVRGRLILNNAGLKPRGAEGFIVANGPVLFAPDMVGLGDVKVRMEGAEAILRGSVALRDWSPTDVAIGIAGELSPTLIAWLWPEHVEEASGRVEIDAHWRGRWPSLIGDGEARLHDLFLHEKRSGRDLRITEGTLRFEGSDLIVGCAPDRHDARCRTLLAKVDETGDLRVDGWIGLPSFQIGRLALHFAGDNLDWAKPGVLSLTVAPKLDLTGDANGLHLAGTMTLVSGRYQQEWEVKNLVPRARTAETEPPFFVGLRLLEQLQLDLTLVSAGSLTIKNNFADLSVSLPRLVIQGTLLHPTVGGTAFVEEGGLFHIPFLRTEFVSEKGALTFDLDRTFPDQTPTLNLRAGSDFLDRYEQLHRIQLVFTGTLSEPNLDLFSTDGWNRTQCLVALSTGGTTDDLRRSTQDDPTKPVSGGGFDGLAKSLSGDLLGSVIEDPLKRVFRLDVARVELGSGSVMVKLCLFNTRYVKMCGTADKGFVSSSRYSGYGELKLSDLFSMAASVEHIEHGIETTEDILTRGRLQLVLKHPIH